MPSDTPTDMDTPDAKRIHTREDFGRELTLLRQQAQLTVRQVAAATDSLRRHSTVGDWFAGRGLPSTSSRELLVRVLAACGVDDPARVSQWMDAWQRVRLAPGRRPQGPEPYRGLASFQPEHAEWFFGREAMTSELVGRLAHARRVDGGIQAEWLSRRYQVRRRPRRDRSRLVTTRARWKIYQANKAKPAV